ncbi:MAG: hypothetical protein IT379_21155 [Deltaproteobacteria bacterium]|nr:hypothetical protein [Deltaproteobacteria bacterium]
MSYRVLSCSMVSVVLWMTGCSGNDGVDGDGEGDAGGMTDTGLRTPDGSAADAGDEDAGGAQGDGARPMPPDRDFDAGDDGDGARPMPPDRDFDGGLACADDCDDGIVCSLDSCDPTTGECIHLAPDRDGDGVGDAACLNRERIPLGDDCDDADPRAGFPDGPGPHLDVLAGGCDGYDNDCDGEVDEGCDCVTGTTRACGVSVGACRPGYETCEDGRWGIACDGGVLPTGEICGNEIDDDCNGTIDDGTPTWRFDGDGDGFGAGEVFASCEPPDRSIPITPPPGGPPMTPPPPPRDCDDADPTIGPGELEVCNGRDDDCDGLVDEGVHGIYYEDVDGDGFGDDGIATRACTPPPGYVPEGGDCDGDPLKFPSAPEICDDFDNNCNEAIDEGCPCTEGATRPCGRTEAACTAGTQRCFMGVWLGMCEGGTRPREETCNTLDDDCDGATDEGLRIHLVRDRDGDGWGDGDVDTVCAGTAGYVDRGGDCDGTNASVHPDASFASTPRPGTTADWDWTCDGWAELEHPGARVVRCGTDADPCAYEGHAWLETADGHRARCGEAGTLLTCRDCVPTPLAPDTLQRCR